MRYRILFALQALLVAVLAAAALWHADWPWVAAAFAVACLTLILGYRAVAKPLATVRNGMYLLREQDYGSRLRRVGQPDADAVVELFNGLMKAMKDERLKNLEQNDFLRKLVEASPMGIAICDFDGKIQSANKAFDTLLSPEVETALADMADGEIRTLRVGQCQIVRCSRHFFMDSGFRRPFFLLEQLTEEIVKAEKNLMGKIVRTMGHEVNNTLGSVVSVLETLHDIHADDADISSTVESCRESCLKLTSFVKGYSDVVKLPEPEPTLLELNSTIDGMLPFLRKMAGDSINISVEPYSGGKIYINADEAQLHRVITNIVKNAVESIAGKSGNIVLRTEPGILEISDDGPGISPENASKIFTPFFSPKHHDRGLGLMLVADILRRHRATFSLATAPDSITRFKITF